MTEIERERLIRRYVDIKAELKMLRAGRFVPDDPEALEGALQAESDEIVAQLGGDDFDLGSPA